jgi:maltose/maltodextrin transport system substrate-binding protein
MQRPSALAAALSLTIASAFACGAPSALANETSANPLRLMVWINSDKGYNGLQKIGDAFAKASGISVVVQHPEGATDKFQQSTAAGKGPDIFCWPHDRLGEWAKAGLVVPIRPSKKFRDEIEESAWKAFTYKGKTWGYPVSIEANGLIYNKALVPTPPETFADVVKIDAAMMAQGKKAILWDFNKSFFTWPMLAGPGGYVFARDANGDLDPSKVGVNDEGAIRAAEVLKSLIDKGQMPRGARYANMESAFARGEIAMMISGPWAWDNAKKSKIDFGVAPIPSADAVAGKVSKPFVGVLGCMIAAPSKMKDISREFLENYVLRPEGLKLINDDVALGVPANKAFYAQLSSDPNIRATMENARRGEPVPNIPEMGKFWPAVDAALEAITNGLQSPKDAMNNAAARMATK